MTNFYKKFLELCNENNVKPTRAVQDAGIPKSSVTRWKEGTNPTDSSLARLAEYFKISPEDLKFDSESIKKTAPENESGQMDSNEKIHFDFSAMSKDDLLHFIEEAARELAKRPDN